jgi:N-acetyl-gamma-glutamyl-phosphate reductase
MNKIKIGIIGGAGYTAGELLRILIYHPYAEIVFVNSKSQTGKPVYMAHFDLFGDTELIFTDEIHDQIDVVFLCAGHGESEKILAENPNLFNVKIIDLSTDFRDESNGFVYGLPEWQKEKIKTAQYIANPGCFATTIELGLLPLANDGLIKEDVHVSAITGSTGAGQSLSSTSHFSWRNNNVSIYKAFNHQHLTEIGMVLSQNSVKPTLNFIPYRGNFTRGIMANIYTKYSGNLVDAVSTFKTFYKNQPFIHISENSVDLKQVINTNKCLIHLEKNEDNLLITSIIDNLTKGASGQAVQNMNLMFGLDETIGLRLKSVGF